MTSLKKSNFENHQDKCRCCLRVFNEEEDLQIKITEVVQRRFLELTQIDLKIGDNYSSVICELCCNNLRTFSEIRKDLVAKQIGIYDFVNEINKSQDPGDQNVQSSEVEQDDADSLESKIELGEYMFNDVMGPDHPETDQNATSSLAQAEMILPKKIQTREPIACCEDRVDHSKNPLENPCHQELFSCDHCAFRSPFKDSLKLHIVKHIAERDPQRFHCKFCSKNYSGQDGLNRRMMKIHEPPKHKCRFEGYQKAFTCSWKLKCHEKVHFGQPDFECSVCNKSFFTKRSLQAHTSLYHKRVRARCLVENCQFTFVRRSAFKRHILTHRDLPEKTMNAYLKQVSAMKFQNK